MSTVALSGNDVVILNNRNITDFADGKFAELTFPNNMATAKTGKNGNSIYSLNETGRMAELKIRLIRGSSDDKHLNGLLAQQQANFAGTVLLSGQVIKKIGDGAGNIRDDAYITSGGIFVKQVPASSSAEGDIEQSVAEYVIHFTNAPRVIG